MWYILIIHTINVAWSMNRYWWWFRAQITQRDFTTSGGGYGMPSWRQEEYCQVKISWTVVNVVFGECHAHFTLNTLLCRLRYILGELWPLSKAMLCFVPTKLCIFSDLQSKVLAMFVPFRHHFCIVFSIVKLVAEYAWQINQSINMN